ncbi:MAG: tetratricopeptide repeat protein, partial [Bacteroidales bacterium]
MAFLFVLCFLLLKDSLKAQTSNDKITEQKAFQFYQQKNYTEALPLFSQLLSLYPKDERYNLHYAACLIETNQEIDKAIKYLQFADSKSNDPIIKYYLGRAYHLNYQFKEAIENYSAFIRLASSKQVKELNVNKQIEMCQNGLELIKYISDLIVVDNRRIKSENYFYSYDLKEFDGKLVIKPKELKSSVDKKDEPANMVIFLPNNSNIIYYGSYGKNKLNGRDIYRIERLADGKWGKPENLGPVINSTYDEDYPFLHANGKTLYFSSKGHNSMGGYDIFKSEFDSVTMTWSKPVNLDFPINTPYDDYLYITDKDNFYAFFTSNRETRDNNITVYKILVDNNPVKREFKDLEEIINVSRLEVSPLAEIKKAEESKQKNKVNEQDMIFANNESNNSNINISSYSFKPIVYKPNLSSQEVVNNLKADNEKIEKNANEIKRQSYLAYISAKENNEKANQKRKEAYEKNAALKNITDPIEAEQVKQEIYQLINDAEDLERQAITAYNIAQNFEDIAAEMNKDLNKSKNLINAIEIQGTVDEAIVDAANKNKERLELSQNKYSSLQKKFEDRKKLQKTKESELYIYEEMLNNTSDSINKIDEQIKELETKIKNSNSETEKNYLALQIDELNKRSDMLEAKQIEIAEIIEKSKLDIENLNSENQFLKQFAEKVQNDKRSIDDLLKEPIAKDQLKQDIFEKELSADIAVAQTVKEKVGQKSISKNKPIVQNKSKSTSNTTVSALPTDATAQNTEPSVVSNQTNNNLIKRVNPLLPNTTITNKATVENIEKEQFNIQYYTNILDEQQKKLEIINNAINKAKDKKEKQLLEQQKNYLVEEIQNHKELLSQSQNKLNEYKKALSNKIDTSITISNEELVLKACKYDNKYEINFSLTQKKLLEQAEQEKQEIRNIENQLQAITAEIKRLELVKVSINDNTEQKNVENQIAELKNQQNQLFRNYTSKIDNNNQNTFNIYNQVLTTVRNYNTESPEVKTANLVEKEIEALNDKSSQLKKEAMLLNDYNEKIDRYKKANIIDQIAIQKQKYAIDLYVSSRQNIAQTSNNNIDKTNQTNEAEKTQDTNKSISIELSPEENKQITEYQTEKAKAETKLSQGKSLYKEIEEKRNLASKTYSTTKKKEILKNIDKKEQEAVSLIIEAHTIYEQANSKKHQVYQNKIKELLENPNVIDDNKSIAIQLLKEADLYYDEAQQVRLKSKTSENNEDKITLLNKALTLEQKAISNQEYALDALTNAEPVEFIATNNITKIDRLEALDKQVDVEDVIRIKTERIIANLNLSESEKIKLDEALAKQQTISQLTTEAEKYKVKLDLAKEIAKNSTNKSERKKAEKSIPKLEKEYFTRKFTAAELTENVNDCYYKLYETKFTEIRPNDKSEEAKQGKQLEKNANKKYIQAKQLREQSLITENPYIAYNYLLQADSIEKSALEDQEKAFGLYLKLKPLEDEIKEYAEKHRKKQPIDDLIVLKTTADITPISKEELA